MSVKLNLFKNGIATGLQKTVRVVEQLVLIPFFLSAWGAAYYGEWLTLTIVPSVLAFSDLGFGSAAANSFVLTYVSGNKPQAADIGKTGFIIISAMVGVGMCISILVLVVLAQFHVFDKALIQKEDAMWAVSLLILARLIGFYSQLFEAYYRAARKAALSINLLTINSALAIAAGLIVLVSGGGIVAFALSQLAVSALFMLYYGRKGYFVLGLEEKGEIRREHVKAITGKGLGYLMSPIWQAVYFQGTTFVVRLVLGPEAVAVFNTVRTLSRSLNNLYSMVNGTVFPELQYHIGAGEMEKARKLFRISVTGVLIVALISAFLLWLVGPWFYQVWTKNTLLVPPFMWNIFIAGIVLNSLWWTAGMVFRATNQPYLFAFVGVAAAVISVILSYFLAKRFGLDGAAFGSLALELIMALYVLPVSCYLLGMSVRDFVTHSGNDVMEVVKLFTKKLAA